MGHPSLAPAACPHALEVGLSRGGDIHELLKAADGGPTNAPDHDAIRRRGQRLVARRVSGAAVTALAVVSVAGVLAASSLADDEHPTPDVVDQPGDVTVSEVGLLDGTRARLTLPVPVLENLGNTQWAGSLYTADTIDEVSQSTRRWRLDVESGEVEARIPKGQPTQLPGSSSATATRLDRSSQRLGLQFGRWAALVSGDSLSDRDVEDLLEGIEVEEGPNGAPEYRGDLLLWSVDSPDLQMSGPQGEISLFLRECSQPSDHSTQAGLSVSRSHNSARDRDHLAVLCDIDAGIELWIATADPVSTEDLERVDIAIVRSGSILTAIQAGNSTGSQQSQNR